MLQPPHRGNRSTSTEQPEIGTRVPLANVAKIPYGGRGPSDRQMRRGRLLVISGTIIAVIGIVLYCLVCFAAGVNQDLTMILFAHSVPFSWATLGIIGAGTLLWCVGSIEYLMGAMDSDSIIAGTWEE